MTNMEQIRKFINMMDFEYYTTREEVADDAVCALYKVVTNDRAELETLVNRALDEMEEEHR